MALTFAEVEGARAESGWVRETFYDITLDASYPTGGETIDPNNVGLNQLFSMEVVGQGLATGLAATTALQFLYDPYTGKLQAFQSGGATPAGTIGGNVTVVGGGIGEATGINPDSNAGVLSKAAATNRTIPIATYLGAAPTFTGTAIAAAALAEVPDTTNLSAIRIRVRCTGT